MGGNRTDASFVQSPRFGPSPFPTALNFWDDSPSNLHCMLSLPTVSKTLQGPTSSRKSSCIGQIMAKSSPETPLTWLAGPHHFSISVVFVPDFDPYFPSDVQLPCIVG